MSEEKRASWSGQLAFVLAAAASAVGLGNLWRFPYLAAKYGGGVFIAVYLALSLTLGFTLLVTEIALGRYSRQSQLTAFRRLGHGRWHFLGVLATVVPLVILPYYNVISGWVVKYFLAYVKMAFASSNELSNPEAFFDSFIAAPWESFVCMAALTVFVSAVIMLGVKNGIEKSNLVMMPVLFLMAVGIAVYVATLPGAGEGIRFYLVPDFSGCDNLGKVVLGAMGQMFYSLSLAMGIMITYGSYMRRGDSISSSCVRIVAADTFVAVLSGFIIIPVVVIFAAQSGAGRAAIDVGPGLMFVTLPKVFASLGAAGPWVGLLFFTLVLFAALTSSISMAETCVASVSDFFGASRKKSVFYVTLWSVLLGSVSAFGYGRWSGFKPCGMPALEFFDFSMNSVLMPVVAALTCVFVGWVLTPKRILAECRRMGGGIGFKGFYVAMVKYFAPLLVLAIFVSEICRFFGIGGWRI
ncbi:MAG: sodium-dependent transporter [Kiritimatiellae bacterium]|nr:sodium-dependent transporter [Kiritimatiellia bacterium]